MTKHEIIEYAFLLLYETLVRTDWNGDLEELYQSTEEMVELPIPTQVKRYVEGIRKQADELDQIIASYSKNRVLNRIPLVNRTILRLALYELRNITKTPVNVVISEAVALSRADALPEDTSFINGVLGAYSRAEKAAKEAGSHDADPGA